MEQYGKLTNNQLEIVTFIDHGNSRTIGINAETAQQFGLKEIVIGEIPIYNHTETYTETDTQILVEYMEVLPLTEVWEYNTNHKVIMNSDRFIAMISEVTSILSDLTKNVSNYGTTEIYLDSIDDELVTLLNYFDESVQILTKR